MDPELQKLSIELSEVAIRTTAGAIADRVQSVMARKRDKETIAELEEIVNELVSDKSELVRIAQAFEQQLVAQRLSADDVQYITTNIVPVLTKLAESASDAEGDPAQMAAMMEILKPLLSIETVTVLQLVGFNFKQAIGQPLTALVQRLILAKAQTDPAATAELQRLGMQRDLAYLEIAKDPDAYERLKQLNS